MAQSPLAAVSSYYRDPKNGLRRTIVSCFFLIVLIIGLRSFQDYGVPYDEGTLTQLGVQSLAYVQGKGPYPTSTDNRFHGTAVELPLHFVTQVFAKNSNVINAYIRRFAVFLFLFIGIVAFYRIALRLFQDDWKLALFGCVLFLLSPRVFAHGFYNSRDIPTMSMFAVGVLTMLRLLEKRSIARALVHGIACGYVLAIRMPSLFLVPLTVLFLSWEVACDRKPLAQKVPRALLLSVIYLGALFATTVFCWPLLWEQPVQHLMDAFHFMSSLEPTKTLLGHTYDHQPWFYIPVWIAITTPLMHTLLFLAGCVGILATAMRKRTLLLVPPSYDILIPLLWFCGPILAIIVTHAGIYQEWRHVLFLYPAFLLIALHGVRFLFASVQRVIHTHRQHLAQFLALLIALPLAGTALWMFQNHPFENVYYALPRAMISPALDLDYWGPSSKQALERIQERNPTHLVTVWSPQNIVLMNGTVFFMSPQKPVIPVKVRRAADYIVLLRYPDEDLSSVAQNRQVDALTVNGEEIVSIYEGDADARAFMDDVRAGKRKLE